MQVVTAVEDYKMDKDDIICFLAGGITGCKDWQKEVINELKEYECPNLVIMNPRRDNFPIGDKNASREQIEWEYNWLERCNIFSMYFDGGESIQPICLYELGRNLVKKKNVVISVEDGYSREQDVIIQTELARNNNIVHLNATPESHAKYIYKCYRDIMEGRI